MFNLLVTLDGTAWETDGAMSMQSDRFGEMSGNEARGISLKDPKTLKRVENLPTLLMYERGAEGPSVDKVRYGRIHSVSLEERAVVFQFDEEAHVSRSAIGEYVDRLGMDRFEENRTHWAVKGGTVPRDLIDKMTRTRRPPLRYLKKLGEGAFGSVWLCEDRLRRKVAAKFFKESGVGSIDWLDQGRALARVDHVNVNRIYTIEEGLKHPETGDTDVSALVLEYVDGPSLESLLTADPSPTPEQLRNVGIQVVDGLAAIHAQGLNHLDLHEENILVADGRVRLIDIQYLSSLAALSTIPKAKRQRVDFFGLYSVLVRLAQRAGARRERVEDLTRLLVGEVFDVASARDCFLRAFDAE